VLKDSLRDADYFLAVARSLLAGKPVASHLNQDDKVSATLAVIEAQELVEFEIFGTNRMVDFSQFAVRGHYESSERLKRYFRAMIWCGRIDLRIAGKPQMVTRSGKTEDYRRQLGTAIVLHQLLTQPYRSDRSGQFELWQQFDSIIQTFVGWSDSMTFGQLSEILAVAQIKSLADITSLATLEKLQTDILTGQLGLQNIRSHWYQSPLSGEQIQLPRSFTVLGQKFVPDSWIFSQLVFDSIIWDEDGIRDLEDKVRRRIPSCLDVAFAALKNDYVVPELVARMTNRNGRKFRDGLPYQHNLAAVRNVFDRHELDAWDQNIYMAWLGALRELSAPTTSAVYPECMRTRAWAMKNLNTQLASWTQLRHDTILYAKQSYTAWVLCSYPTGFVEPVPNFWDAMKALATTTANAIGRFPNLGTAVIPNRGYPNWPELARTIDLGQVLAAQFTHLQNFANTMEILKRISFKELMQMPLTAEETDFFKDTMENHQDYFGTRQFNGWYPRLFYRTIFDWIPFGANKGSDRWDPLVVDAHTDVPNPEIGDPGCVLHEAVGNVHLMMLAVDNGLDRMVYAGPVLSHYEFEMPGTTRKSDSEWKEDVYSRRLPPQPEWTKTYLVPGPCSLPAFVWWP
jgi:hypothetical protein